jgi:hypothetical protein
MDGGGSLVCQTPPDDEQLVVAPSTWLLSTGWRLRGLISPDEVPAASV